MTHDHCYCSFCGKIDDKVAVLIGGINAVFICDECVDLCGDLVREKRAEGRRNAPGEIEYLSWFAA